MNPRTLAILLPPLIVLGAIFWVIENYGKTILIAFLSLIAIIMLFVLVQFIRLVLLGKDSVAEGIKPDLQWDLYIAISGDNITEAKKLLAKGANPFQNFHKERSPSCTNAKNCYGFAQSTPRREEFLTLFNEYKDDISNRNSIKGDRVH